MATEARGRNRSCSLKGKKGHISFKKAKEKKMPVGMSRSNK